MTTETPKLKAQPIFEIRLRPPRDDPSPAPTPPATDIVAAPRRRFRFGWLRRASAG